MKRMKAVFTTLLIPLIVIFFVLIAFNSHTSTASAGSPAAETAPHESIAFPNTEIEATQAITGADLRITTVSEPHNVVLAGEQFTYTIFIDNLGPISATNIVVTDTLVTTGFVRANGCSISVRTDNGLVDEFDCNFALATGVFDLGTFGANWLNPRSPTDMGRIIITINLTAETNNDLTNITTVTSETYDPDLSNNIATDTISVLETADLRLIKVSSPTNTVRAGEQFTYTIIVDNLGPSIANNIVITDTLVTSGFVDANGCSISVRTDGGLVDEFNCNFALSTGVFDLGTFGANWLNPRSPTDMGRIIITINGTAEQGLDMTNITTVTADTFDPDLSNNLAISTLSVTDVSDLSIEKSVDQAQLTPGEIVEYTLVVENHGPSTAENVVVYDYLPPEVTLASTSVEPGPGSCIGNAPVKCALGNLGVGEIQTVILSVIVDGNLAPDTLVQNDAAVFSDVYDLEMSNNFDSVIASASPLADLAIMKTQEVGERFIGEDIEYTLVISNHGPSDAIHALVVDYMPVELADVRWDCLAMTVGASCTSSGSGDIIDFVDLPAGGFIVYIVHGTVSSGIDFSNTAVVLAPQGTIDPNEANNTSSVMNWVGLHQVFIPISAGKGVSRVFAPDLVITSLKVTDNNVRVVIKNVGLTPVVDPFWVDVYVSPYIIPSKANQVWNFTAPEGLVWGIGAGGLPLDPGESLVLNVGDIYYYEEGSSVSWPIDDGLDVYAQVDSFGPSDHGAVQEIHEVAGLAYNNVYGPSNPLFLLDAPPPLVLDMPRNFADLPAR